MFVVLLFVLFLILKFFLNLEKVTKLALFQVENFSEQKKNYEPVQVMSRRKVS